MTAVRPAKSRFTLWTAIALLAAVVALGLPQSALAAPQQPTNLTATALDHDTVSLTWSHPDHENVDHYQVLRRSADESRLSQIATMQSSSFQDDGLQPETKYTYRVKAVDAEGAISGSSVRSQTTTAAAPTITPVDPTPEPPTDLTATAIDHDTVSLTWSHPDAANVDHYRILRHTPDEARLTQVGTSTTTPESETTEPKPDAESESARVTRQDSTDATLSALALADADDNVISLTPAFATATKSYTASVASGIDEITVTPTVNESNATVEYLDADDMAIDDADITEDGQQVSLAVGENTIKVKVTAEDDSTTETYTVVVTNIVEVSVEARTSPVTEGADATFTLKRDGPPTVPAANPIQDTSDNQALALSNQAVTNSAPTSRSVAENTAAGVDIGLPVVATGSSGAVTYTLGGTDAASFEIVAATGQLQTKAALDYETRSGYEVTVTATDTDGSVSTTVAIEVTNVIELTTFSGPTMVTFAENGATRVATFSYSSDEDRDGIQWLTGGVDRGLFSLDSPSGALRFLQAPDFENPLDVGPPGRGTNNSYELKLVAWARDSGQIFTDEVDVKVTVTDVDEAGALSLSSTRPALGAVLTAVLTDPDGVTAGTALWQWERSTGRNAWAVIDGAAAASYTPVAADTNTFLRVSATYADEHGTGKTVSEVAPNVVTGPLLTGLTAETNDSQANSARGLYPAFDPLTLHYGIGCNSADTLVLTVSAAANARVAVAGVQAASAPMAVDVSEDSDVAIRVTDASGAGTTYVVHCLPEVFFEIETHTFPNTDAFEDLLLFNRASYFTLMDRNGVPRLHLGFAGAGTFAVRFHRVGADGAYRYGFWAGGAGYTILDEDFEVVDDGVSTVAPLTRHNSHDFQILEDGNYLVMAYERATRDFSDIDLPYFDGDDVSSVGVNDAAVQIVTPGRHAVFTWNSWGNMAIEDCVQHRFPVTLSTDPDMRSPDGGYAHINGMHVVDGVLVASMRGCSKVLGIDVTPGVTRGDVLWRMGRTNLSDAEWTARDIGPRPLDFINDPEGEFCGQHTARILPNGNVFLFDNGSVCVIDPWTFDELGRAGNDFSRAVEYALDLENHEAVFVRDHSLRGERSHLGYANGNVDVLDNGDWLVSWGRPLDVSVAIPDNERATLVDPATGQEKLGLRFRELPASERDRRINATVAPAEVLAPQPVPLTAEFPASSHTSVFNLGAADSPQVVVAFSRPVVDFDATTPSLSVTGATVASVSAHVVAAEPANAYLVTLTPDGAGAITFHLVADRVCADGGICSADGTMLTEVPPALVIGPPPSVAFERATHSVGEGATLNVAVLLSNAHEGVREVTIPVALDTSESASEADLAAEGNVTFAAGETRKTFSVRAIDDDLVEGSESAILRLGALPDGITAGTTTEGTVTVTDPDRATISFTVPTVQVAEGGHAPLTFAVTNGVTFQRDQTITLTVGGTATAGEDFTIADGDNRLLSAPYALVLPAGASFITATVRVVDDTDTEPTAETVTVSALLDLTSASLGSRTVTIAPSDPAGAPVITGSPVAAGSARVGETLVADTSLVALEGGQRPAPFSYDWVADGDRGRVVTTGNIYRVRPDDAGFTISVGVGIQAEDGSVQVVRSATTNTVAASVPASPSIVNATVGAPGSLHLTWEAPTWDVVSYYEGGSGVGDGGSPITGYTVQWKEATASWETAAAVTEAPVTTTSHAITGLTDGTAYTVRVHATNDVGDGSPSPEVTVQDTVVNRAPVIAGDAWVDYAENGTGPVHTFLAQDPESDTVTWSLAGDDSGAFSITGGVLRFARSPDYEDPNHSSAFRVTVQAADATNRTAYPVAIVVTDVDEPPEISGVTTISGYDENGAGDVAAYTAMDPEGDSNITWSLGGTDQADFTITDGVLKFASAPDYERPADSGGNNQYEVTIQATDSNNKRGELHVDVIVQNVDEPPVITGPDTVDDFPENSPTSRQVGRYTASDPEGATVTMSLPSGGVDFSLAGNGVLTFKESPDYEEQSSYSVTVRAAAGSHTVDKVVTVNIQNVEEPGAIDLSTVQPQEGTALTVTLDDDDGPTGTTWQWRRTSSRGSAGAVITNADSRSYTPAADDVGSYLRAVASYDDGHGTGKTAAAVSVNRVQEAPPVPEPPVFPADGDYERTIRENLTAGRNLGAPVAATDGNNDRLTYHIAASDEFEIVESTGQLRTKAELDHEGREQHFVTVTATDPGGLTDTVSVTITVEDVDETPVVSGPSSLEFEEGTSASAALAAYTSTDPDRKGIDLVLSGADGEDFTLSSGGVLTFNEVPNFEEPADSNRDNRYQFTVEAREQGDGASVGRLNVAIRVTNVDEPGMVQTNAEEPRVGQTVRLNVEDEDNGVNVTEWKWEKGEPNSPCGTVDSPTVTTWETISGATSSSYTPTAADQGHCIRATAFYNDRAGTGRTEQFLTPNYVEIGPFFTQAPPTYSVRENTAEGRGIGRVQARHSNSGEALTYRLSGADAGYFTIDNNGQLQTSATPLDYETQPGKEAVVEITAEDNDGRTATIAVTIAVTDECASAGEPPCAPGRPGASSASDTSLRVTWSTPRTPSGTSITGYDLQYRESDSGGSWIPQSVAGTDRSQTIENLVEGTTYEVQVRTINDGSSRYGEWSESGTGKPGTVSPPPPPPPRTGGGGGGGGGAPANMAPEFTEGDRTTRSVAENTPAGADIGDPVAATDFNRDTLTYSLRGLGSDLFDVDSSSGQLLTKGVLDYETESSYTVFVWVQDNKSAIGRPDTERDTVIRVALTVANEDEAGAVALSLSEPDVDVAITAALTDPDGGLARVVWSWERSADQTAWTAIRGAASAAYTPVAADKGSYLRATASYTDGQGRGKSAQAATAAAVLSNAAPEFLDVQGGEIQRSVAENTGAGEAVDAPVMAMDAEDDALTYALGGADAALFSIDEGTGQIRVGAGTTLDYEADKNVYEVTVTATDSSGASATVAVAIAVTNVGVGSPLADAYDADGNEAVDRDEILAAVADYFAGAITKEEAVAVIRLYFAS